VKANLKAANSKARDLLSKLQALADRGIDGEQASAKRKIARLKARFDFAAPDPAETPDLFQGSFRRAGEAKWVYSFGGNEFDVANSVKWAIESATGIPCLHRNRDLLAEAAPGTAKRLTTIADHIANSFRTLIDKFSAIEGVSVTDRSVFVMGLYDGMMNEVRNVGQRLPSRPGSTKKPKGKKPAAVRATGLHIHPYTVAVSLGKQIRFSASLEQIAAELEAAIRGKLTSGDQVGNSPAS
jgi:hypothetical protein